LHNTYFIPNVKATAYSCRTHLPPNTAFRGFGGPQGMFVIEAAIAKAAEHLKIPATDIQQKNLLKSGDEFPYGQLAESEANECWNKAEADFQISKMQQDVADFNASNTLFKKDSRNAYLFWNFVYQNFYESGKIIGKCIYRW
jgi:xanthine dehydrogenase large subunit